MSRLQTANKNTQNHILHKATTTAPNHETLISRSSMADLGDIAAPKNAVQTYHPWEDGSITPPDRFQNVPGT